MSHPRYQDLSAAQIPEVRRDDGTVVRVVAGEVDGVAGAVTEIYAEPEYLDVALPAGCTFVQPVPKGHAALAYAFEGEGRFGVTADLGYGGELDGVLLTAPQMAVFGDGDEVRVEAVGTAGAVPADQRQAAGRADRPLRAVRHEQPRGTDDRPARPAERQLRVAGRRRLGDEAPHLVAGRLGALRRAPAPRGVRPASGP